jgi:hypothetical protein
MTLDEIDRTGLIREAYAIEGITPGECRSIFLDWAIKLPAGTEPETAIRFLLEAYGCAGHPMTQVLTDGLAVPTATGRRGGYRSRRPAD